MVQVADGDPLLDLTRQEQNLLSVGEHPSEHFVKYLSSDQFCPVPSHVRHDLPIQDKTWSIVLVTTVNVETPCLEQLEGEVFKTRLRSD